MKGMFVMKKLLNAALNSAITLLVGCPLLLIVFSALAYWKGVYAL